METIGVCTLLSSAINIKFSFVIFTSCFCCNACIVLGPMNHLYELIVARMHVLLLSYLSWQVALCNTSEIETC